MKKFRKLLSFVMLLAMLVGVFTVSAYAADDTPAHVKSITNDGEVADSYTISLTVTGKDKTSSSTSTTVTNGHADIVLVIDVTSSMSTTMSDGSTRLAAIQSAATQFVSGLATDADSKITLITFGMTSNSGNTPVWTNLDWSSVTDATKTSLTNTISSLTLHSDNYSYDTTYAPGLNAANEQLSSSKVSSDGNNKYVIFFSDGDASDSQATIDTAANAVKANATVFSIGLPATYWYESNDKIESVASDSSKYFEASNAAEMVSAFNSALQTILEETTVSSTPMTDVVISDTLSDYVEQNGSASISASDGSTVSATPSVSGKTVSVTILEAKDGVTYTLSIPVKPTQKAQDEANAASTDTSTFPSNKEASLQYAYGDDSDEEEYEETPQIAVKKQTFTVTWKNEDGAVLETDANVPYGTIPSYDGDDPAKAATAQYTYTFDGWDKELVAVTADVTYTAKYKATTNQYTVTFMDEDGTTVLKEATKYDYGTSADSIAKPDDPTKTATAQYTYTFDGWTPEISEVTGDVTYTAKYTETLNKYTVIFVDEDGTVLQAATEYDYGTPAEAIAKPADPTKAADSENTYTFNSWSPAVTDVTGDATYTATYSSASIPKYTVKFVSEDTLLSENQYASGTPAANVAVPADPTKTGDAQYSYTFKGWDKEITDVTGDATYTATYTETLNKYTVTFVDEDGTTVLKAAEYDYGTAAASIDQPEAPTKAEDEAYTYTFAGWTPEIADVTGDATYTATYTATAKETPVTTYTVTFVKNNHGTQEVSAQQVAEGGYAVSPGSLTDETMTFAGWFADEALTTLFDFTGTPINKNTTIYAKWVEIKTGLEITKNLTVTGRSTAPSASFTFAVENTDAPEGVTAPTLTAEAVSFGETSEATSGVYTGKTTIDLGSAAWTAAGDYKYTISENSGTYTTVSGETMTYSNETFETTIRVAANDSTEDDAPAFIVTQVVVAPLTGGSKTEPSFDNTYTLSIPTVDLTVSKTVVGPDDSFSFTIAFDLPEGNIYREVAPVVKTVTEATDITAEEALTYGTAKTFTMKNGSSVVFTVPVGATYTVSEAGKSNYTGSVVVTENGAKNDDSSKSGAKGQTLSTTGTAAALTEEGNVNSAAFTNTYETPPMTGVVEKTAPFLILAAIALLGFAAYVFDRRRKAARR